MNAVVTGHVVELWWIDLRNAGLEEGSFAGGLRLNYTVGRKRRRERLPEKCLV